MKGIGDKVLGWFVVQEEEESKVEEQAPVRAPKQSTRPLAAPIVAPGASHDASSFAQVYRAAGVRDEDREKLARITTLMQALPADSTPEVRRAIVSASLEAFGVRIDGLVVTGEGALAALDGHVAMGQRRTEEVLAQAEANIARLSKEIAEVRRLMDLQVEAQAELVRATEQERTRVRAALDFLAPRAVAMDAPRLVRLK